LNHAVDAWLRRGTLAPELGHDAAQFSRRNFEEDAKRYLKEFGLRSLARSLKQPEAEQVTLDIADRFTEPQACFIFSTRENQPRSLEKAHFCAFAQRS
jgi:hypothetical protein